jgi:type 1 fimbria pilin
MAFVLAGLVPAYGFAACEAGTNDGRTYYIVAVRGFNPPPFSPGEIPIGGIIYEASASGLTFRNATDPWGPWVRCNPAVRTYLTGVGALGANNVYATGIPNIGIRIIGSEGPFPYLESGWAWSNQYWSIYYAPKIQLIKTGNVTAPGVLTGAYARYTANSAAGETLVEYQFASPVTVTPKVPTCKVDTTRLDVPMGRVITATALTGVGSTTPLTQPFEIKLTCSGGDAETTTNAYVTLTDASNPGNTSKTLSLSKSSTATGVGIQIVKDNLVLGYGPDSAAAGNTNQWRAGTIKQGQTSFSISLQARYVQTAARITTGSANANATFTMSYQ